MSSIFGHRLAAVYQDHAYAFRPRASWLAMGAAFTIGIGCAIAVMKISGPSDNPALIATAQEASGPATASSARIATGKNEAPTKRSVRVIAPDVVPPPPNVPAALMREPIPTREASREPPKSALADTNVGVAPRNQADDRTGPDSVPLPPPKPTELRAVSAETVPAATAGAAFPPAPAPAVALAAPPETVAPASPPAASERAAKSTRKEAREARREAKRMQREARRLAQERAWALRERNERDGFSPLDGYRTPDGRRITAYRQYDEDRGRAMAYGQDRYRRGFFGLFDFD